jgi:hypothetical protein
MNNKQITLIFSLIALILLSFTACTEPVDLETGKDASFTITINGSASRSVLSWDNSGDVYQIADLDHTIILSNGIVPDKSQENLRTGDKAYFTVTPGNWDITVWAYLNDVPKAYSFKSVDLKPGDNGVIPMIMGAPPSDKTSITTANITIDAPVKGETPATAVSGTSERFTAGTITWEPSDNPFQPSTVYTATVTLTAISGHTFTGLTSEHTTINGEPATATNNTGGTITLSYTFMETAAINAKNVSSISVITQPRLIYTHGDTLDLSLLKVKLTYDDDTTEDVSPSDFSAHSITTTPANNTPLERSSSDSKPVTIKYGSSITAPTSNLTVNAKSLSDTVAITVEPSSITAVTYNGSAFTPTIISVKHTVPTGTTRTLDLNTDYTVSYEDNTNVGTAKITITGINDYTDTRTINFTINKAPGAAVSAPIVSSVENNRITIAVPTLSNEQTVEYGASKTNDINTVTEWRDGPILYYYNGVSRGYVNYIFARSKGDANYNPGEPSVASRVEFPYSSDEGTASGSPLVRDWLESQPPNTPSTPYIIKMTEPQYWSIAKTLNGYNKYFILIIDDKNPYLSTTINSSDFQDCTFLVGITILGNRTTTIGQTAFRNCTSLTSITIPNNVTSIGDSAFSGCTSLTSITFPTNSSFTTINNFTFSSCTSLTSIVIPNSVTSIGNSAFNGCTNLTSITIPNSVTSIGNGVFNGCTSLTTINVDPANNSYSLQDGVLYNKDKTTLVVYPAGKTGNTFTIPNSVTDISQSAFYRCTFTNITIPNGVNSIGNNAFTFCTSLTSVTIGSGVTSIGNNVFSRCTSLNSVTFATGSNIPDANFGNNTFPEESDGTGGNTLKTAYNEASPKAGTYTRAADGSTWTKQ